MGANRKLQQEIDRTLKKVAEGIEIFDQIWEKVYDADNHPQKEKYEGDLKKEIKKLQRFRDQIKTWISGNDIKDKAELIEARKRVERQMERFKVCEKEMKVKAFSKMGLGQATKLDPKEKARNDMRDWINETVDKLTAENEAFDAEMEALANNNKKKNKLPARHGHLEESIVRHKAHITRLEQMLRLLDNEALEVDDMTDIREMVDDYIERNQESVEEFENPDEIYAEIVDQLDSLEAQIPVAMAVAHVKAKDPKDKEKEKEKERERERQVERERAAAQAAKQQLAAQQGIKIEEPEPSADKPPALPRKSIEATGPAAKPPKEPVTPTGRTAVAVTLPAKVDAPSAGNPPSTPVRAQTPFTSGPTSPMAPRQDFATGSSRHTSLDTREDAASTPHAAPPPPPPPQPAPTTLADWAYPGGSEAFPQLGQAPLQQEQQRRTAAQLRPPPPPAPQTSLPATAVGANQKLPLPFLSAVAGRTAEAGGAAEDAQQGAVPGKDEGKMAAALLPPGQVGELLGGQGGRAAPAVLGTMSSPQEQLKLLTACAERCKPQLADSQWQSVPPRLRPFPGGVPASYPTEKTPIVQHPALFERLDTEALFFAFYYQPGSYQQYLAARELKRQSWRYHKQHAAWFQRHEEPKTATEEYEQGTYVYFDYNIVHDDQQVGWCYRLKQDFMFKYDALEDELRID
ncbi:General negative regulator of transcription subunit 3 [Coccomyxa sp. Obi]|nr:General negative regulator of transcription subunit 3 [Coccomyxa sp. Obi]